MIAQVSFTLNPEFLKISTILLFSRLGESLLQLLLLSQSLEKKTQRNKNRTDCDLTFINKILQNKDIIFLLYSISHSRDFYKNSYIFQFVVFHHEVV